MTKPSLALIPSGVAEDKLFSVLPSNGGGDFDFSRGSKATRVNSQGLIEAVDANVPRLDYSDGGCPSLLIEPQRTNFISTSNDFNGSGWLISDVTATANQVVSPDGTLNASKLEMTANGSLRNQSQASFNDGYAYSIFIKKGNSRYVTIRSAFFTQSIVVGFDLDTLTAQTNGKIEDYGNDWYRLSITKDISGDADKSGFFYLYLPNSLGSQTSVSGNYAYFYGGQIEDGTYPTSYIPTQGTVQTRLSDECNRTNIQEYIGQTEGTLFLDFEYLMDVGTDPANDNLRDAIYFGSNTDVNERIVIDNYRSRFRVFVTGSLMGTKDLGFTQTSGTALANTRYKVAVKYKDNDFKCYRNGEEIGSATGVVNFASPLNSFYFSWYNGTLNNQKRVNDLRIYKTGLTDQELIELTTI